MTDNTNHTAAQPLDLEQIERDIMNIPCRRNDDSFADISSRVLYKEGHRDARHDAADLIAQARAVPSESAAPIDLQAALDAEFPIPDNPHASVIQRTMDARHAMGIGWMAAMSAQKARQSATGTTGAHNDIEQRLRRLATDGDLFPVKAVDASVLTDAANTIADLRAQLAARGQGEPLAWRFKRKGDRFWQTTGDREVAASIGGVNVEIVPLYAAPASAQPDRGAVQDDFAAEMLANQTPLPPEFAHVLVDNLQDLYISDDAASTASQPVAPSLTMFDDGSTFQLTGWAGGAAPGGEFSTVTCERQNVDGTVEVIEYVRAVAPSDAKGKADGEDQFAAAMQSTQDGWQLVPKDPKTGTMLHMAWLSLGDGYQPSCTDMCRVYEAMLANAPVAAVAPSDANGKADAANAGGYEELRADWKAYSGTPVPRMPSPESRDFAAGWYAHKARCAATSAADAKDAAVAAIAFALEADEGMEFLRCWNEGDFDACRREWPEAPEAVYIGADPLHPTSQSPVTTQAAPVACKFDGNGCGSIGPYCDKCDLAAAPSSEIGGAK